MSGRHGGKRNGAGRRKGGSNSVHPDIRAIAGQHTEATIERLAQIIRDGETTSVTVKAIELMLAYGHGKPRESVDVSTNMEISHADIPVVRYDSNGKPLPMAEPEDG